MVRAARFVLYRARLDIPNDLCTNGESSLQRWILELLPAGREIHVFDVGANVGRWSAAMLATARQAGRLDDLALYAFEPSSYTFALLSESLSGQPVSLLVTVNGNGKLQAVQATPEGLRVDLSRCMQCGLCAEVCPEAIQMRPDFELAARQQPDLVLGVDGVPQEEQVLPLLQQAVAASAGCRSPCRAPITPASSCRSRPKQAYRPTSGCKARMRKPTALAASGVCRGRPQARP